MLGRSISWSMLLLGLLVLVAAGACGGDDDDDASNASESGNDEGQQASSSDSSGGGGGGGDLGDLPFDSGSGSFVIDGEEFAAQLVVSCEPFDASEFGGAENHEDDFDFVASDGGNTYLQGEVSFEEVSAFSSDASYTAVRFRPFVSRTGDAGIEQFEGFAITDPEGNWYTSLLPQFVIEGQPPDGELLQSPAGIEINGKNIRGALTLDQEWPEGAVGAVDVSFDLDLPDEVIDCSTLG